MVTALAFAAFSTDFLISEFMFYDNVSIGVVKYFHSGKCSYTVYKLQVLE